MIAHATMVPSVSGAIHIVPRVQPPNPTVHGLQQRTSAQAGSSAPIKGRGGGKNFSCTSSTSVRLVAVICAGYLAVLEIAARLAVQYAAKQCRACPCARRISQISAVAVQAAALDRRVNVMGRAFARRQSCQHIAARPRPGCGSCRCCEATCRAESARASSEAAGHAEP